MSAATKKQSLESFGLPIMLRLPSPVDTLHDHADRLKKGLQKENSRLAEQIHGPVQ